MRIQLTDLITRPEPSSTPAITLWLTVVTAAALAGAIAVMIGG